MIQVIRNRKTDTKVIRDIYKLRSWIDPNQLTDNICEIPNCEFLLTRNLMNWTKISSNETLIQLIEENQENIDWDELCSNICAMSLIKKNPTKINKKILSSNPSAVEYLEKNTNYLDWDMISKNSGAINFLKKNISKINWFQFSMNRNADKLLDEIVISRDIHFIIKNMNWSHLSRNEGAIKFLLSFPHKIILYEICKNSNAIDFLKEHNENIDWSHASINPRISELLEYCIRPEELGWYNISRNTCDMNLLENNQDKIDYYALSSNPNIITYNYEKMINNPIKRILHAEMKNIVAVRGGGDWA